MERIRAGGVSNGYILVGVILRFARSATSVLYPELFLPLGLWPAGVHQDALEYC